jgi:ABC-type uncharacterized transport system involved in gliding motility auxiliary subunit
MSESKLKLHENPARLTATALVLLGVFFVALNVLVSFTLSGNRIDLTEDKLYSVSDASQSILDGIDEPITLQFFYSKRLGSAVPAYGVYAERVLDVLKEYEARADGGIRLEIYDPEPFTPVEDRATTLGVQAVPLENVDGNVFFGLVGSNTTDDIEAIPFLQPDREAFLEYDLTRMIYRLSQGRTVKVGVLGNIKINGDVRIGAQGRAETLPPFVVADHIRQVMEIEPLDVMIQKIPDDISILMVVHPRELTPRTQFAIDQYLLAGGKAVFFVDPLSEEDKPQRGWENATSTVEPLFKAWGLEMPTDKVVGDRFAARRVGTRGGTGYVTYVPWLLLRGANLDQDSPITGQVESVALASAGHLKLTDGSPLDLTPLLTSSPGAMLYDTKELGGRNPNPEKLLSLYKPGPERLVMAGLLRGSVPTAFPDGQPALDEDQDEDPTAVFETVLSESQEPMEVIVVADTDVLIDRFWVQFQNFYGRKVAIPGTGNGDFVVNMLDALTGSSVLLELRGRGQSYRPFDVIEKLKREADRKFQSKERELQQALANAETSLSKLRQREVQAGAPVALTAEERAQVQKLQGEILGVRGDLRAVQASLRADVKSLESRVQLINIAAVPALVALLAILLALYRGRRRRRATLVDAES